MASFHYTVIITSQMAVIWNFAFLLEAAVRLIIGFHLSNFYCAHQWSAQIYPPFSPPSPLGFTTSGTILTAQSVRLGQLL